jgi:DNA-directed RNA polymerase subunit E'/Rpb7
MEHVALFEEQVSLTPKDMRIKIDSIEALVADKLRARLEGRCSRHGFVVPETVKVLSRSMGNLEKGRFTGSIIFHVQAEGTVLNPPDGAILEGEVIRKNKMGIYVSYRDAIRVIVPRDLHIGNEAFEAVEIGETVEVEIRKSRFQVNDPYILSVGYFVSSKGKGAPKTVKPVQAPVIEEMDLGEEGAEEDQAEDQAEEGAEEGAEEFEQDEQVVE